jgi:hypothetical protein
LKSVSVNGGIQTFTVPASGTYTFVTKGPGGGQRYGTSEVYGHGAVVTCSTYLTAGTKLWILVGQKSDYYTKSYHQNWIGGSGGTFVAKGQQLSNTEAICVAGGGSGHRSMPYYDDDNMDGWCNTNGQNADGAGQSAWLGSAHGATGGSDTNNQGTNIRNGFGHGGKNGNGGQNGRSAPNQQTRSGYYSAAGGAGFKGDGLASTDTRSGNANIRGYAFRNGGAGGTFSNYQNNGHYINGGFGGGGSGSWGGTGGGGGYSGGAGDPNTGWGGGGGSYCIASPSDPNSGPQCNCEWGQNKGNNHHASVTITYSE